MSKPGRTAPGSSNPAAEPGSPGPDAHQWVGSAKLLAMAMNRMKPVAAYSSSARLFSEQQRLVLYARDGGCTFPGRDVPAPWCEIDHLQPWTENGPTTIDNGHLVCKNDHDKRRNEGWQPKMINNRPAWVPRKRLVPSQTPRYNTIHHAMN